VFNRFWRADPSRQRKTGGTGLGLAIALEDARLHGGWLQAVGRPGHGARFRLTLPLTRTGELRGSPLQLDPDEDDAEISQAPAAVAGAVTAPSGEAYFTATALSTLSSGFRTGATADPDDAAEDEL
jgi:two-component system sensor histidine kinase MtrB